MAEEKTKPVKVPAETPIVDVLAQAEVDNYTQATDGHRPPDSIEE